MTVPLELNSLILLLVAVMNGVTLYYSRRTEKNTNSMKDELVRATGEKAHAAGKEEARAEGEAKAAILAEGASTLALGIIQGSKEKEK